MPGKWGGRAPGAPPPRSANEKGHESTSFLSVADLAPFNNTIIDLLMSIIYDDIIKRNILFLKRHWHFGRCLENQGNPYLWNIVPELQESQDGPSTLAGFGLVSRNYTVLCWKMFPALYQILDPPHFLCNKFTFDVIQHYLGQLFKLIAHTSDG